MSSSMLTLGRPALLAMAAAALALSMVACNSVKPTMERSKELVLYDFSSSMRWGDFDKAYDYVDPKYKKEHPLSSIDRERFKQIEVAGYEVIAKNDKGATIDQEIQLEIINKHTQVPRSIAYHEHWAYDAESKKWWLTTGLPDISPQN